MPRKIKPATDEFEFVGEGGIDERKRFSMAKVMGAVEERLGDFGDEFDALHFRAYVNASGQVLLDPALTVPVREMWLYRNRVALAKVREGLAQAAQGDAHDLGSFAKHADNKID